MFRAIGDWSPEGPALQLEDWQDYASLRAGSSGNLGQAWLPPTLAVLDWLEQGQIATAAVVEQSARFAGTFCILFPAVVVLLVTWSCGLALVTSLLLALAAFVMEFHHVRMGLNLAVREVGVLDIVSLIAYSTIITLGLLRAAMHVAWCQDGSGRDPQLKKRKGIQAQKIGLQSVLMVKVSLLPPPRTMEAVNKACPLTHRHVAMMIDFLYPHEAFARGQVSRLWQQAASALDAREAVLRLRPSGWVRDAAEAACLKDAAFCKRLLRDWCTYLSDASLQVAYVSYLQHLVFTDPAAKMVAPPQGADLFPIDVDRDTYRLVIETFSADRLWWRCLEQELFHWPLEPPEEKDSNRVETVRGFSASQGSRVPQPESDDEEGDEEELRRNAGGYTREDDVGIDPRALPRRTDGHDRQGGVASSLPPEPRLCEAVPGYKGSCAIPKLPEDVLAVLALNAAWFTYSFWTRKLQAVLLLRDGRYLLVGTSEMQGTIDSQAAGLACRCFVADSLASIVLFAQDDISRQILRVRTPESPDSKRKLQRLNDSSSRLQMPRVEGDVGQEEVFGKFPKADEVLQSLTRPPLFSNTTFDQDQARASVKRGAKCRVRRESPTFGFASCSTQEWDLTDGPVNPAKEQELPDGFRLLSLPSSLEDQPVQHVDVAAGTVDLVYTDYQEWAVGNSGHTGARGSTGVLLPPLQEADVEMDRVLLLPSDETLKKLGASPLILGSIAELELYTELRRKTYGRAYPEPREWYWHFQNVWDPCGCFTTMSLDFEHMGPGVAPADKKQKKESPKEASCSFLELADLFRDTCQAHIHRCELVSKAADLLPEDAEDVELLMSALRSYRAGPPEGSKMWPSGQQMLLGKRLMLRLLRTEKFWKEWTEKGGESPTFVTTLFGRQRFVHLVEDSAPRTWRSLSSDLAAKPPGEEAQIRRSVEDLMPDEQKALLRVMDNLNSPFVSLTGLRHEHLGRASRGSCRAGQEVFTTFVALVIGSAPILFTSLTGIAKVCMAGMLGGVVSVLLLYCCFPVLMMLGFGPSRVKQRALALFAWWLLAGRPKPTPEKAPPGRVL
eukprot:s2627_g2.t1